MDGVSPIDGVKVAHLGLRCSGAGPYLLMGDLVVGIGATPHCMFGSNNVPAKRNGPRTLVLRPLCQQPGYRCGTGLVRELPSNRAVVLNA